MYRISLRDLQWRRRRFTIAILAAALAFGLALVMSGTDHSLQQEGVRTVRMFSSDQWVVADDVSGPFTTSQLLPASVVDEIRPQPGVSAASPLLLGRTVIGERDVNVIGYDADGRSLPASVADALASATSTGAVIDSTLPGVSPGDTVSIGGQSVAVVGEVSGTSFYFGAPTLFLPIADVQQLLFAGQSVVTTVLVEGHLDAVPEGAATLTDDQVRHDFDRVLKATSDTMSLMNGLLWLMAAGILAAMVYVGVLERLRDFATLKATGATNRSLVGGLLGQAIVLAIASGVVAIGICQALVPLFPFAVDVPSTAYTQLAIVTVIVGTLASLAGLRRVARIDPALAFGGA
jgi:putative ABC transport system permease protein